MQTKLFPKSLQNILPIKDTLDDSDIEVTPEDEAYQPDPNRPPAEALMLDEDKANRLNAFLKNNYGRKVVEVTNNQNFPPPF